jgi:hypothetical protein
MNLVPPITSILNGAETVDPRALSLDSECATECRGGIRYLLVGRLKPKRVLIVVCETEVRNKVFTSIRGRYGYIRMRRHSSKNSQTELRLLLRNLARYPLYISALRDSTLLY